MMPICLRVMPWLILSFAALNVIFLGGKRRAFGVFVAQLHVEFNQTSLAELNWIGDSYAAVGYLTTGLSTSIILSSGRRFGLFQFLGAIFILLACISSAYVPNLHWLFFTHTVLHGIGSSLILSTVGLVVNEHFDHNHRYHILATTLVSGGSVASIVFVQFYAYLVENNGWRKAMIVLGVLYFFITGFSALVFRKNASKGDYRESKCSFNFISQISARQAPLLVLWTIDRIITSIVTYGMLLNLTDYKHRHEKSLSKSAVLTTLFAAGEASTYLIGAIATGITKDLLKGRLKYILLVTTLSMAIGLSFWELFADNFLVSHMLSYVCGFCLGPSITFLFPAGEEMTRLPGHMAYPFSLAGMGIGMALSPLVSAVIAQAFYYKGFFLVQGGLMLLKFFCLGLITILLGRLTDTGFNLLSDHSSMHGQSQQANSTTPPPPPYHRGIMHSQPYHDNDSEANTAALSTTKAELGGKTRWSKSLRRLIADDDIRTEDRELLLEDNETLATLPGSTSRTYHQQQQQQLNGAKRSLRDNCVESNSTCQDGGNNESHVNVNPIDNRCDGSPLWRPETDVGMTTVPATLNNIVNSNSSAERPARLLATTNQ